MRLTLPLWPRATAKAPTMATVRSTEAISKGITAGPKSWRPTDSMVPKPGGLATRSTRRSFTMLARKRATATMAPSDMASTW